MRLARALVVLAAFAVGGCGPKSTPATHTSPSPAKVEKLPLEVEIARITLTEAAQKRLGITLAPVTRERVTRRRVFGGEVMIPSGKSIIVSAPVAGLIAAPDTGSIPLPGQHIAANDLVMLLIPLLSPEREVPTSVERLQMANARATLISALTVAEGEVERSESELEGAQVALGRAQQLLADKAGSARDVDTAQAQVNMADSALHAAKHRTQQLQTLVGELASAGSREKAMPFVLTSPQSGTLRNVSVTRGQTVTAGTTLFEIVDTRSMWVRVPIYVNLLPDISDDQEASVVGLDGRAGAQPLAARPVAAPPTADPLSSTADLYFEVANLDSSLRPGQRVGIELVLRGEDESLVVPSKALLYDIYGDTWVYVKVGDHAFARARATIRYSNAGRSVLAAGPRAGSEVVVDGAAELFGTEFGAGK